MMYGFLHFEGASSCAWRTWTSASCWRSTRRKAPCASRGSVRSSSMPWPWACCASRSSRRSGQAAARALFTRFAFAHGWRMAEALCSGFHLGQRQRLAQRGRAHPHAPGAHPPGSSARRIRSPRKVPPWRPPTKPSSTGCTWAGRRLRSAGHSLGLPAGTSAARRAQRIYVLEDRCIGQGHETCHFHARTREQLGRRAGASPALLRAGREPRRGPAPDHRASHSG